MHTTSVSDTNTADKADNGATPAPVSKNRHFRSAESTKYYPCIVIDSSMVSSRSPLGNQLVTTIFWKNSTYWSRVWTRVVLMEKDSMASVDNHELAAICRVSGAVNTIDNDEYL